MTARHLRHNVWLLLVGSLSLAVGAASFGSVAAVVDIVAKTAVPTPAADALVAVYGAAPPDGTDVVAWLSEADSFESVATCVNAEVVVEGPELTAEILAAEVSPSFFDVLGATALHGRVLAPSDEPDQDVLIVAEEVARRLGVSARGLLGRTLRIAGRARTVVGVMPAGFSFPGTTQAWVPRANPRQRDAGLLPNAKLALRRGLLDSRVIARLAPGVTRSVAQRKVASLQQAVTFPGATVYVAIAPLMESMLWDTGPTIRVARASGRLVYAMGAGALISVLLVAFINDGRDLSIRVALGEGRVRSVLRCWGCVGVCIAVAAPVAAGLALVLLRWHLATGPALPLAHLMPDLTRRALMWTGVGIGVAAVPAALLATAFASYAATPRIADARRAQVRVCGALLLVHIATAVAICVVCLHVAAGLHAVAGNVGPIATKGRTTFIVTQSDPGGVAGGEVRLRLNALLRSTPGVHAVATTDEVPFVSREDPGRTFFTLEGVAFSSTDVNDSQARVQAVSEDYFRTMGIPIVLGREFTEQDDRGVIVDDRTARRLWPGASPIGQRVGVGPRDAMSVVGVAATTWDTYDGRWYPRFYVAMSEVSTQWRTIVWSEERTSVATLTDVARGHLPRVMVSDVIALSDLIQRPLRPAVVVAGLAALSAALSVLLGAVGATAVLLGVLRLRSTEVAIRAAIGGTPQQIWRDVVRRLSVPIVAAVAVGTWGGLTIVSAAALRVLPVGELSIAVTAVAVVTPLVCMTSASLSVVPPAIRRELRQLM